MSLERVDAIVVGAGVVGLAIARSLALAGAPPLILEREDRFGSATSSRNSEVIHAGLYYPEGSLKAELCVEGKERLYAFCRARGVACRQLGKLVFAHDAASEAALGAIERTAAAAGVSDLKHLDGREVRLLEPELVATSALLSPSTGIVDSHAFMLDLLGEAEANGASLICNTSVGRAARMGECWRVWIDGVDDAVVEAPLLINAAGLGAQRFAQGIEGLSKRHIPKLHLAKGTYYTYSGAVPFRRLIYPVPEPGGLGVHMTLDLGGQARFGPDVEWIDEIDYSVDPGRQKLFLAAAQRIFPKLDPQRLRPGYAGVRPKLSGPGEPSADFVISTAADHGLDGLINLFGVESPGLTAAMAIAERIPRP